ncbi:IS607 family transposase [Helicobacter pylori]|uniref:IS607 family transposase n=1 Tax=Helicobacter pylori TaxID=210 RepID=UPI000D390F9E|nr:IS607 family transposase [Helicobacter pylori]PUD75723.1 IS607 family transposase [Helicobacter pylori]
MKSKEVLKILKISRVTLWKYVKSGKIRVKQEPNGYYIYNDSDVYSLAGIEDGRLNVVYARVSTQKQKQDLQNQIENCISFINAKGISVDSIYSDIKSGMSLDRRGFMELLNAVMAFKIKAVYISYKDRLARLSYELVEKLFSDYGTKIVIINQCESISLEQELFEDIMQTIHSFSRQHKRLLERHHFAKSRQFQ